MGRKAKKPWTMPTWMEPYRELITDTGGNDVEELIDDTTTIQVNALRAVLAVSVKAQVRLLLRLHEVDRLR